jgi:hypothetical protein
MMLCPVAPPVPQVLHGALPVEVSLKQVPQPLPHQVLEPPKMAGLAAAVYTPELMPACQLKALLPVPQPQAPFVPS